MVEINICQLSVVEGEANKFKKSIPKVVLF